MASLLKTESTLTDRYQTTIPDAVRKALHLNKRDKILYTLLPDGQVSISKIEENQDNDPIIDNFLNFLAEDLRKNPKHLVAISQTLVNRIESIVEGVEFDLNELLLEDDAKEKSPKHKAKPFGKTL